MQELKTLLRLVQVLVHTGESRTTLYTRIKQGLFPPPISLGALSVAWPADDVSAIVNARIAGKSDAEIKVLVQALVNARLTAALPADDVTALTQALIAGKSNADIQALIKALEWASLANT